MTDRNTVTATMTDLEVVMQRSFNAPRSAVFDAWTRPEYLRRWMAQSSPFTMPVIEVDLKVGGIWRFVLHDPSDGSECEMRSTYLAIVRPELISWHETWLGCEPEIMPEYTNTLVLQEDGAGTVMTLTKLFKSKEDRDAGIKYGMANADGAAKGFANIDKLLEEIAAEG